MTMDSLVPIIEEKEIKKMNNTDIIFNSQNAYGLPGRGEDGQVCIWQAARPQDLNKRSVLGEQRHIRNNNSIEGSN